MDGKGKIKIFIAEDDKVTAALLKHIMKREGFDVIHAPDGREAVSIINTLEAPGIALLDVLMPFRDGFHLIKEIKSRPEWWKVPIIMLTSKTNEGDVIRALDAGADDYITKPFNPVELLARLRRYIKEQ